MKTILRRTAVLVALNALTLFAASAETRRLEIEIEPIIILNCIEQVDYTLDTAQLLSASTAPAPIFTSVGSSPRSVKQIEARFSADSILNAANSSTVEIVIEEACSVRGLSRGEGFLIDVKAADQGLLVNPGADGALAINGARAKPSYGGHFASQFAIPQSRIRLDRAIDLDVELRVDLRFANGSGRYSSPVDGVFSIEVSAP